MGHNGSFASDSAAFPLSGVRELELAGHGPESSSGQEATSTLVHEELHQVGVPGPAWTYGNAQAAIIDAPDQASEAQRRAQIAAIAGAILGVVARTAQLIRSCGAETLLELEPIDERIEPSVVNESETTQADDSAIAEPASSAEIGDGAKDVELIEEKSPAAIPSSEPEKTATKAAATDAGQNGSAAENAPAAPAQAPSAAEPEEKPWVDVLQLGQSADLSNWWGNKAKAEEKTTAPRKAVFVGADTLSGIPWTSRPKGEMPVSIFGRTAEAEAEPSKPAPLMIDVQAPAPTQDDTAPARAKTRAAEPSVNRDTGTGSAITAASSGQWFEYAVQVRSTGTYDIDFRLASERQLGGTFQLHLDGTDIAGPIHVPRGDDWTAWRTVTKSGMHLQSGRHLLRVLFDAIGAIGATPDFNWFRLIRTDMIKALTPKPPRPTGVAVAVVGTTRIEVTWTAQRDVNGFKIERAYKGESFRKIATCPAEATRYMDLGLKPGKRYYYRVKAINAGGTSPGSEVARTTLPIPKLEPLPSAKTSLPAASEPPVTADVMESPPIETDAIEAATRATTPPAQETEPAARESEPLVADGDPTVTPVIADGGSEEDAKPEIAVQPPAAIEIAESARIEIQSDPPAETEEPAVAIDINSASVASVETDASASRMAPAVEQASIRVDPETTGQMPAEMPSIHEPAQPQHDGLSTHAKADETWLSTTVGRDVKPEIAPHVGNSFNVCGVAGDVWGKADAFAFAYRAFVGDVEIVARLRGFQRTNFLAKAGVMIRETLAGDSRHAGLFVMATTGARFLRRGDTAGPTTNAVKTDNRALGAPLWLKLVRSGGIVAAFRSSDGRSWQWVGSETMELSARIHVGLAAGGESNMSSFDHVAVSMPSAESVAQIGAVGASVQEFDEHHGADSVWGA